MKRFLFLTVVLCLSLPIAACDDNQQSSKAKREFKPKVRCNHGTIKVHLGGLILNVPRGFTVTTADKISVYMDAGDYCTKKFVDDALRVKTSKFSISEYNKNILEVQEERLEWLKYYQPDQILTLENGIKRYGDGKRYTLPIDAAPTLDGVPVEIYCSREGDEYSESYNGKKRFRMCDVNYVHPLGVRIRYSFGDWTSLVNDFIGRDKRQRKRFTDMIVDQSEVVEEKE